MANDNSEFRVMDMARSMAGEEDVDIKELFAKHPVSGKVASENQEATVNEEQPSAPAKKVPWSPDPELLNGMSEMQNNPVVYDKKDLKEGEHEDLKNIADDNALQASREAMDELGRKRANIEDAKKRHGIRHFNIPEGPYHASIFAAAGDTNYKRAQAGLDEIFNEIKELHPEFIREWTDADKNNLLNAGEKAPEFHQETGKIQDIPEHARPVNAATPSSDETPAPNVNSSSEVSDAPDIKVVIDKSKLPEVAWSQDEIDKIKKSRTVELNIVEARSIEYSQIEEVDENAVDSILAPYQRKANDIVAALPASKYRCTVRGLSYTEVIDLSNSQEMNNLDGEKKKWSIAFSHIHNQSIGPWEEYQWYIDPNTHKTVKIPFTASIPPGIDPNKVHEVTKFEDFLQKTSFMDLEFILWKILCATAMDQEIISIDCHAIHDGRECGKSYDWIYRPNDLLMLDSIDPAVLEDMEHTGSASTTEEIMKVYNSSMLQTKNTAKLPSSEFVIVFGHISAYEYLTAIYSEVKALEDAQVNDPTLASRSLIYTALTVIKAVLIPQPDGTYKKISGIKNLVKVIETLDEIDWQTISEIVRIMVEPYQFRFALRDIVCPQCKNKSIIPIENMTRLLFIVARSLSSVQVTLKRI